MVGAANVFVLGSDYEGNSPSVIEAMAAGLPIVSTAAGGVPELLQNGKQGLIVQPGRADELSEAMMTILKDRDLPVAIGAGAAARAKEKLDVSAMVRAYEDLYDDISVPCEPWGFFHLGRKSAPSGQDLGA